ncbi:hypothetical protein TBS_06880 [Thermobispora bispora]|jgi:hypothetical protein|uniref:Low molecular weight protein antigen 6 PH domain-containing protein n=2 Tax=Thermobispora bispora TaxID=2006 RepID=D6YB34_THEBD|nr:hypothetical protein Tbis_1681 [Thermobispora bispora DSM 43833]MBX6168832.1 PH domain-containing protein [Thermobispora bispora]
MECAWRVPWQIIAVKAAGAVLCAVLAVAGDPGQLFLAGVAALGFAGLALRDLLVPVRLAAGPDGLVIAGLTGRRRIPWDRVRGIRAEAYRRYGITTELLEIDTGDDVHLFSRWDLGARVPDVAGALARLRP